MSSASRARVGRVEQRWRAWTRARDSGYELNDRLMRNADSAVDDALLAQGQGEAVSRRRVQALRRARITARRHPSTVLPAWRVVRCRRSAVVNVRAVVWRERSIVFGAHVGVGRERSIVLGVRTVG